MSTQQLSQVEAIVLKYETLASNIDCSKTIENKVRSAFYAIDAEEIIRTQYGEHLIAHIYELRLGKDVELNVKKKYTRASSLYIKGLLTEEEEMCLVDNFAEFVDYAFDHFNLFYEYSPICVIPSEWSRLVPFLLENKSGKILILHSDRGREFVGLDNCELTVGYGFKDAAIRALACGLKIHSCKFSDYEKPSMADFTDEQFDAVIADVSCTENEISSLFSEFLRIVKKGGDLLIAMPKGVALSEESLSIRKNIVENRILKDVILLPSDKTLFHCVKNSYNSLLLCDVSNLTRSNNERIVDTDAFLKKFKMVKCHEGECSSSICRVSYDNVNSDILLPIYYLRFPKTGTSLSAVVNIAKDFVLSDECDPSEKVVTVNNLSTVFTKGAFKVDDLSTINHNRIRRYYRIEGPTVIMAVSEQNIAIGYTTDSTSFLVPRNLYALSPRNGVDVKYLACMLLSNSVRMQLIQLVYGKGILAKLAFRWSDYTLFEMHSEQEQQAIIQNTILDDYAAQERFMDLQEKGFRHAIRLRKHALSQNISAFDSLFRSLEYCMREHKGELNASEQLSPVSPITVADAIDILHSNLQVISERVNHLTDDQDWGSCEAIEPQQFIEEYEKHHTGTGFRFSHLWMDFETNYFEKDIFDKSTGKLIFCKGESMNAAWFPRRALMQVFDNILSNAREHGFTDKSRQDYVIQTSWTTDGLNMLIKIANNGAALPKDINTDLVLEYGYTTALNQQGHAGIGGGEMAEIMHKFGGDIQIISTPDKAFTVTYVLSMPLASIY